MCAFYVHEHALTTQSALRVSAFHACSALQHRVHFMQVHTQRYVVIWGFVMRGVGDVESTFSICDVFLGLCPDVLVKKWTRRIPLLTKLVVCTKREKKGKNISQKIKKSFNKKIQHVIVRKAHVQHILHEMHT